MLERLVRPIVISRQWKPPPGGMCLSRCEMAAKKRNLCMRSALFGHPSRSENNDAGYRAEGWCDGGDESMDGDPEQPCTNAGAEAEAPGDGAMRTRGRVLCLCLRCAPARGEAPFAQAQCRGI
jgi:hypothetical protein